MDTQPTVEQRSHRDRRGQPPGDGLSRGAHVPAKPFRRARPRAGRHYYRDEWYQGAKFENKFNGPAYQAIELLPPVYDRPEALRAQAATCTGKTTLDFTPVEGRFGPLWKDRDLARHLPREEVPVLLTQGFVDQNVHPDHVQEYGTRCHPTIPSG